MPLTHLALDRTDWVEVRKVFKKRWPPPPDIEDDADLKCEELEAMRSESCDLGTKVKYWGQDLYSHITDHDLWGLCGNGRGRYTESVQQRIVLSSRNFFAARFLLLQNFGTQVGSPCTRMQTKHVPVGPAGRVVVSVDSSGEAELGSVFILQSKDGGGSESQFMSFTRLDLRGSRVKGDDGGFLRNRRS